MTNIITKYNQLKREADNVNNELMKSVGKQEQLLAQLKLLGYKDIEKAKEALADMKKDFAELTQSNGKILEEIENILAEVEDKI
jgi:phage-related protein